MEGCFIVYNVTAYAVATSSVLHILYWVPLITSQQADASFVCMHILQFLQDVAPHGSGFEDAQYCFGGSFLGMSVVSIIP